MDCLKKFFEYMAKKLKETDGHADRLPEWFLVLHFAADYFFASHINKAFSPMLVLFAFITIPKVLATRKSLFNHGKANVCNLSQGIYRW